MRKVAVFFGGKSCENEISVLTGVMVLNLIDKSKYEVYPVYVHTDGAFYTSAEMFDVEIFRKVQVKNFQQIFFDGGTMYALSDLTLHDIFLSLRFDWEVLGRFQIIKER